MKYYLQAYIGAKFQRRGIWINLEGPLQAWITTVWEEINDKFIEAKERSTKHLILAWQESWVAREWFLRKKVFIQNSWTAQQFWKCNMIELDFLRMLWCYAWLPSHCYLMYYGFPLNSVWSFSLIFLAEKQYLVRFIFFTHLNNIRTWKRF